MTMVTVLSNYSISLFPILLESLCRPDSRTSRSFMWTSAVFRSALDTEANVDGSYLKFKISIKSSICEYIQKKGQRLSCS